MAAIGCQMSLLQSAALLARGLAAALSTAEPCSRRENATVSRLALNFYKHLEAALQMRRVRGLWRTEF